VGRLLGIMEAALILMAGTAEQSPVVTLAERLGRRWPSIARARDESVVRQQQLQDLFRSEQSADTSVVVFGSIARKEVTKSSDVDWILLIDGQSVPEHKDQERNTERILCEAGFVRPGGSGVFGRMVGSHELVHNIGGEDDLNSNTTRRVLLLLEALAIGSSEAFQRVRRQILTRYIADDRGLVHSAAPVRIPRFLLNDLTRYWRTVTVDFVYKQRAGNDEKWALRNAKLRMSRKLVFAAGLLRCFLCHLDPEADEARAGLRSENPDIGPLTEYLENQLLLTPLELLAKSCLLLEVRPETATSIFDAYDQFLALLDNESKRRDLSAATEPGALRSSAVWDEVREVSRPFHTGLVKLFLSDGGPLSELTKEYGVF
jgi:hypothetical protein